MSKIIRSTAAAAAAAKAAAAKAAAAKAAAAKAAAAKAAAAKAAKATKIAPKPAPTQGVQASNVPGTNSSVPLRSGTNNYRALGTSTAATATATTATASTPTAASAVTPTAASAVTPTAASAVTPTAASAVTPTAAPAGATNTAPSVADDATSYADMRETLSEILDLLQESGLVTSCADPTDTDTTNTNPVTDATIGEIHSAILALLKNLGVDVSSTSTVQMPTSAGTIKAILSGVLALLQKSGLAVLSNKLPTDDVTLTATSGILESLSPGNTQQATYNALNKIASW